MNDTIDIIGSASGSAQLTAPPVAPQASAPSALLVPFVPSHPPSPRRSSGKVARLPLEIRNLVNHALRNGRPYQEIIASLQAQGFDGFTKNNLSRWAARGYRDWLHVQERFESSRPLSEKAQAILGQLQPGGQLPAADFNEALLAVLFQELLQTFDSGALLERPDDFLRAARGLAACISARAQRQRATLDRLNYELQLRKIESGKAAPPAGGISPETLREIEEGIRMM